MHAFFLAVPESFGGPVFRSRHFFGAACDFVFRLLVPEQMFSKGRNLFKGVIFTEQKLRLPSAQAFRRKKKKQRFQRQVSFTVRCKRLTVKREQCNSQSERKDGQFSGGKCRQVFECAW